MRAEWGCTLKAALFAESLTAAVVLWPALLARHGVEVHRSPSDRARQEAKVAKRTELAQRYDIVPTPPRSKRPRASNADNEAPAGGPR